MHGPGLQVLASVVKLGLGALGLLVIRFRLKSVWSPDPSRSWVLLNVSSYCMCTWRPCPLEEAVALAARCCVLLSLTAPLFLGV